MNSEKDRFIHFCIDIGEICDTITITEPTTPMVNRNDYLRATRWDFFFEENVNEHISKTNFNNTTAN